LSRNSKKLQIKDSEKDEIQKPKQTPPSDDVNKLFGLSFSSPTEMVSLPSQGEYYPSSSQLSGVKQLEIKHMTAKEEDILAQPIGTAQEFTMFDKLIASLLVDKSIDPSKMIEEDKTAILLSARRTGYGESYESNSVCDLCQKLVTFEFDLSKTSFSTPQSQLEYDGESDCFLIQLPVSKINIKARVLNKEDVTALDFEEKQKSKINLDFNRTLASVKRIIYSANDIFDPKTISKLAEVLPAADAKYLLGFDKSCYPRINTTQEVVCPGCKGTSEKEVPLSWAFFRIEF
jgi:hypothetical protein